MKFLTPIIILIFSVQIYAQHRVTGNYFNRFGGVLELKSDSTFDYILDFGPSSSWSVGKWTIKNDTIFLKTIPVYDTLLVYNSNNKLVKKELELSVDKKIDSINPNSQRGYNIAQYISLHGQNRYDAPTKFILRRNKLIEINESGELKNKRVCCIGKNKKKKPHFKRKK